MPVRHSTISVHRRPDRHGASEREGGAGVPHGVPSRPRLRRLLGEGMCDCPNCRRARGEGSGPFEDFEDFDEDVDDLDIDEIIDSIPPPPGVPAELAKMMLAEAMRRVLDGESVDSAMSGVSGMFGLGPGSRGKRKKGGRR